MDFSAFFQRMRKCFQQEAEEPRWAHDGRARRSAGGHPGRRASPLPQLGQVFSANVPDRRDIDCNWAPARAIIAIQSSCSRLRFFLAHALDLKPSKGAHQPVAPIKHPGTNNIQKQLIANARASCQHSEPGEPASGLSASAPVPAARLQLTSASSLRDWDARQHTARLAHKALPWGPSASATAAA
jgi:hypothetical protein